MPRPATVTLPELGWSNPAIRFRSVVLPLPERPTTATNSPALTSRSIPVSASKRPAGVTNVRLNPRREITRVLSKGERGVFSTQSRPRCAHEPRAWDERVRRGDGRDPRGAVTRGGDATMALHDAIGPECPRGA